MHYKNVSMVLLDFLKPFREIRSLNVGPNASIQLSRKKRQRYNETTYCRRSIIMARAWFSLAAVLVIGCLGLGYCALMYNNGIDPLKDGGLIILITGLVTIASRLIPPANS